MLTHWTHELFPLIYPSHLAYLHLACVTKGTLLSPQQLSASADLFPHCNWIYYCRYYSLTWHWILSIRMSSVTNHSLPCSFPIVRVSYWVVLSLVCLLLPFVSCILLGNPILPTMYYWFSTLVAIPYLFDFITCFVSYILSHLHLCFRT